jgi:glutamine cyclotransferase
MHNLNELEYDVVDRGGDGTLLANVFGIKTSFFASTPTLVLHKPFYNLQQVYPHDERTATSADVLNGIALVRRHNNKNVAADASDDDANNIGSSSEVWVTGKKWPWMYRIRLLDE